LPFARLAYIRPPIHGQYRSKVSGGGPWGRRTGPPSSPNLVCSRPFLEHYLPPYPAHGKAAEFENPRP